MYWFTVTNRYTLGSWLRLKDLRETFKFFMKAFANYSFIAEEEEPLSVVWLKKNQCRLCLSAGFYAKTYTRISLKDPFSLVLLAVTLRVSLSLCCICFEIKHFSYFFHRQSPSGAEEGPLAVRCSRPATSATAFEHTLSPFQNDFQFQNEWMLNQGFCVK